MHAARTLERLQNLLADPRGVTDQQRLIDTADLRRHRLFNKGTDAAAKLFRQIASLMPKSGMLFQAVNIQGGVDPTGYPDILPGQKGGVVKTAGIVKGMGAVQLGADGKLVARHQLFGPGGLELELHQTTGGNELRTFFQPQGMGRDNQGTVLAIKTGQTVEGAEQDRLLFLLDQMNHMVGGCRLPTGKKTMDKTEAGNKGQE